MKVSLVSISNPMINNIKTAEELIVYTARVSNPSNQLKTETAPKLLKYCLDNKHFSIFEMADMCVEIKTSRAISAQILRHRSFTFQEFSQRYAEVSQFETYPARRQDIKNRQNSLDDMSEEDKKWFLQAQEEIISISNAKYHTAIGMGIAKEQARFLLPLSTQTTLYMKGNLRSWITYLDVRCDPSTQLEHREIAQEIKKIFTEQFPVIAEAKGWNV
jgi:thymidylate synthase (FAD)